MKSKTSSMIIALFILAIVAGTPNIYADTVIIQLSDGTTTKTICDGCTGDGNSHNGVVTFVGSIGQWNIDVTTGTGSSVLGPGRLDLNSVNTASLGTNSTLTIMLTQTGMVNEFPGWRLSFGGTSSGIASLTYDAWAGNGSLTYTAPGGTSYTGGAFALTSLIGTVGPFTSSPFNGSAVGSVDLASLKVGNGTYSLTQRIQITGIAHTYNTFRGDANLTPVPEPTSIVLLGIALFGGAVLNCRVWKPAAGRN